MPATAEIQHRPAKTAAQRVREWRERNRAATRTKRVKHDIGPAIDPGDPFTDDLDRCEAKWTALLAGARF